MGRRRMAASAGVLDAGALIAIERLDRRARTALETRRGPLIVPAPVLAQVWRDGARQARLGRFLRARGTVIEPFDRARARAAGVLLGKSGTSDVVDASVIVSARLHRAWILTSDPADLRKLDPGILIEAL